MPVQETLDGIAEIRAVPGMQVGGIVINMARPVVLSQEELKPGRTRRHGRGTGRRTVRPELLAAALAEELSEHARLVELAAVSEPNLRRPASRSTNCRCSPRGSDLAAAAQAGRGTS